MNVSNEAIKLGQTQVEFDCLYGNRTDLTTDTKHCSISKT